MANKIKETWSKSGYKTTEFYAATAVTILGALKTLPLPPWAIPVIWTGYAIARGLSKLGGPEEKADFL